MFCRSSNSVKFSSASVAAFLFPAFGLLLLLFSPFASASGETSVSFDLAAGKAGRGAETLTCISCLQCKVYEASSQTAACNEEQNMCLVRSSKYSYGQHLKYVPIAEGRYGVGGGRAKMRNREGLFEWLVPPIVFEAKSAGPIYILFLLLQLKMEALTRGCRAATGVTATELRHQWWRTGWDICSLLLTNLFLHTFSRTKSSRNCG